MEERSRETVPGYETTVPPRALVLSVLALVATGLAATLWPESLETLSGLVWLLALVPSFLFAYYRGWEGAAVGLLVAMIVMIAIEIVPPLMTAMPVDWRVAGGVAIAFIVASLGAGALAETLRRQKSSAIDLAFHDGLTGLGNRRLLDLLLGQHFALALRGIPLAIAMFDLDGFKQYNDRHGHAAGDEALRAFADLLRGQTRESNAVGRFGGEEFLALLPGADISGARAYAERIREALSAHELSTGDRITVSAGVAVASSTMAGPADLVRAADAALYAAKSGGRNRVEPGPQRVPDSLPSASN